MSFYQFDIRVPGLFKDRLIIRLTSDRCLGVIEEKDSIIAYFPGDIDIGKIISELSVLEELIKKSGEKDGLSFKYASIPDQDWNESWKKGFKPLDVGARFTILPPWEKRADDRINLIVDPGMAFGTGHHETTRSCLLLIEKYDGMAPKNRFLDLGTGTGLLAIAASKLGYREIVAVDTDPLATEAARMNMKLNGAVNIEVREGSIDAAPETYDCIAANIISGVLIMLAPHIAARLNHPGIAILSGILAGQADEVIAEMRKQGLSLTELFPDGKWASLVMAR